MASQGPTWISGNLRDLLPGEFFDLINDAATVAGEAADILRAFADVLNMAGVALEALNILGQLAELVDSFRRDILNMGLYYQLNFDEPVRQLLDRRGRDMSSFMRSLYTNDKPVDRWWGELPDAVRIPALLAAGVDPSLTKLPDGTWRKDFATLDATTRGLINRYYTTYHVQIASSDNYYSWIGRVIRSFDDLGDANRPIFGPGANVACCVIFFAIPTGAEFVQLFQMFMRLFPNRMELGSIFNQLNYIMGLDPTDFYCTRHGPPQWPYSGYPIHITNVEQWWTDCRFEKKPPSKWVMCLGCPYFSDRRIWPKSTYPDWVSARFADLFPPAAAIVNKALYPVIRALQTGDNIITAILYVLKTIEKKIRTLEAIVRQLEELLQAIEDILSVAGFHAMWIDAPALYDPNYDTTAIDTVKRCMRQADRPGFQYDMLIVGTPILAGGPGYNQFKVLFGGIAA